MEETIRIVKAKQNGNYLCALEITLEVLQQWYMDKKDNKVSLVENLSKEGLPLIFDASSTTLEERLRVRASKANDNAGGTQKEKYRCKRSAISIRKNEIRNQIEEITKMEKEHKSQMKTLRYKNMNNYLNKLSLLYY